MLATLEAGKLEGAEEVEIEVGLRPAGLGRWAWEGGPGRGSLPSDPSVREAQGDAHFFNFVRI